VAFTRPTQPKCLRDGSARAHRASLLHAPHIAALTGLVDRIRRETGRGAHVPYFDPLDAGVEAECLFILQAPGGGAVASGFVSRDNNDESARHFFELTREAGLYRGRTITWNAVPWHAEGSAITPDELQGGLEYLDQLFALLPRLKAIVMLGGKAQKLELHLRHARPRAKRFSAPLPSPLFINRSPENRQRILSVLREVAACLGPVPPAH
jgi:uracil-DNA glycosylase